MNAIRQLRPSGLPTAVAAALLINAPQVLSQVSTQQAGLEEVVVTAQRREEGLQDVPISVQAFDAQQILNVGAQDISDLGLFTPNVEIGRGVNQPRYKIRGIGTDDFGVGADPAVGVYVDGVYIGRSGGSKTAFNDIERVEILNGPQGTALVWATSLSGNHNVGECSALVSPSFSLAGCSSATLTVRHWFTFDENSCWPDCGGGVVQVSTNGGLGWTSLTSPGYTTGSLEWLGSACTPPSGEPGWNGSSGGWRADTADLSPWVGNDTVQVRFLLGAKGSPWYANLGWYIDAVTVD